MRVHPKHQQILLTLLAASAAQHRLTVPGLAQALESTLGETQELLVALDRAQWVDAGRVRLTLTGFALAVALGAGAQGEAAATAA